MHALTGNYKLKITTEQGRVLTDTLLPDSVMVVPAFHPAKILRTPGDYKTFRTALIYAGNLLRGGEMLDPGETKLKLITSKEDLTRVGETLQKYQVVAADLETTGLSPYGSEILVMGISFDTNKSYVLAEEALEGLNDLFALPGVSWVWHNGKFDLSFLKYFAFHQARVDHDTILLHYALNETKGTHDLEQLSAQLLGAQPYKAEMNRHAQSKKGLAGAPKDVIYRRVAVDADYTLQIFKKLLPQVEKDENLKKLYYDLLLPASAFLQKVEARGLYTNIDTINELEELFSNRFDQQERIVIETVGDLWDGELYVQQTEAKSIPKEFKPTSTKQLAWILFDQLHLPPLSKKGRSTDQEVLVDLRDRFPKAAPLIDAILGMRATQKDLSTYVQGIRSRRDPNGRVHPSFLIHGTQTGRLSCRNPNLQNVSKKRKTVRRMFEAAEGHVFLEADYKGAELRVLAAMSGDMFLSHVFAEGRDLHDEVARHFFGANFDEQDRMKAKTINFGIPYGRSEYSIAEQFNITEEEARSLIQAWFERAPQAAEFLLQCELAAIQGHVLRTPFGRYRRFGLITPEVVKEISNEARNFKIQSIASDLTLLSAIKLDPVFEEKGIKIINLVHDSILFEVPDDAALIRWTAKKIEEVMVEVPKVVLGPKVPFEIEIKYGLTWDVMELYTI